MLSDEEISRFPDDPVSEQHRNWEDTLIFHYREKSIAEDWRSWMQVTEEAIRVHNLMCPDGKIDDRNPVTGLYAAPAECGYYLAFREVARALGVPPDTIEALACGFDEEAEEAEEAIRKWLNERAAASSGAANA